jgi:hypothetical protein
MDRAQIARITSSTSYRDIPLGFIPAEISDIPNSVLARGATESSTGGAAKLRAHTATLAEKYGGPDTRRPFGFDW